MTTAKPPVKLIPPDLKQCQAVVPNPKYAPFSIGQNAVYANRTLRCTNLPTVVTRENKADEYGLRGRMALCDACLAVAREQLGADFFTVVQRVSVDRRKR